MTPLVRGASSRMGSAPWDLLRELWLHRSLISSMCAREIAGRYRGSVLGLLWFVVTPLLMIAVYTLVFGLVFQSRVPYRPENDTNPMQFGVYLFSGLLIFTIFSEVVSRAPNLVLGVPNLVKKVVFPLEILAVVATLTSYANAAFSCIGLFAAMALVFGEVPITALYYPFIALLLFPWVLGLAWIISAIGVYLRDISQFIGLLLTALMFLSPIFVPLDRIPTAVRPVFKINPVTEVVEAAHVVLFKETSPDFTGLMIYGLAGVVVCWIGWRIFHSLRDGFADVV